MTAIAYLWFVGFLVSLPIRALTCDYNDFNNIFLKSFLWPVFLFKKDRYG
jgi:hypothetical protein